MLDLHVHSIYSKDSMLRPEVILKIARKRGLDGVAVVDHGTIKGGLATRRANDDGNFTVIVGSEIKTEYGDIIGLFLQDEIASRRYDDAVEEIKRQDGLVILAHPYRKGYVFPLERLPDMDAIEAFNARSPRILNVGAQGLTEKSGKPAVAGSDAHLPLEIGRGQTVAGSATRETLLKSISELVGVESNYYFVHGCSMAIEQIKKLAESKLKICNI